MAPDFLVCLMSRIHSQHVLECIAGFLPSESSRVVIAFISLLLQAPLFRFSL